MNQEECGKKMCKEVMDMVFDFTEGTLSTWKTAQLQKHMDACPACEEYVRLYQATTQAGAELAEEEVPPEMIQSTLDFLRSQGVLGN